MGVAVVFAPEDVVAVRCLVQWQVVGSEIGSAERVVVVVDEWH